MTLVVTLTVRREAIEAFRRFERAAARIMAQHGGAIERAVVLRADANATLLREIHIVTFPDDEAFEAYRSDPQLRDLVALRDACVVATEILVGEEGPSYRVTA
jgi:uncharacterized protein (DUF1330 family)